MAPEEISNLFKGKRITLMGLGLLGRGIGDAKFLAEAGAELTVTDLKSEKELAPSLSQLREVPSIRYVLGRHDMADFRDRDLILYAAGVPFDSPYLAEARSNKIPITQSAALFARCARKTGTIVVGVTGTRGKTTTAMLIAAIAQTAGRDVLLGGNVPGVSTLALLPRLTPSVLAVLELDSWQLQGFREEGLSPNVAVFTTFYPDHLNYYRGDLDRYLSDKAEIFLHQGNADTLILGEQVALLIEEKYGAHIRARVDIAHATHVPESWSIGLLGQHNRGNVSCALHAARALGIPDEATKIAAELFVGVPGRLELVREIRGIKIYNDTTSTTPEATIAALQALDPGGRRNILLIMGGSDKGLDMSSMREAVHAHCKKVFFLSGTGTERIRADAPDVPIFDSLQPALLSAMGAASAGDSLLFSPAFASFGMFTNEYDRGEQFNRMVAHLS